MSCNQKYSGAIKGFLIGSLLVFSLMFVGSKADKFESSKNTIPFDEAVSRLKSDEINEIRIQSGTAEFYKDEQITYATGVTERQITFLFKQAGMNSNIPVNFAPEAKDPLVYLFQILFWLFFLSPPIIVVLLLIIIKKMDAKS